MKNKILFRADGNSLIGLGHLYRIFALIEMVKENFDYEFLTKSSSTESVISETLDSKFIPENVSIENEPEWLESHYNPRDYLIIADGYQFDRVYQKSIKDAGYSLFYIDDLAAEPSFADVVINHSAFVKESDFRVPPYTKFALGTDYSILRPSFIELGKERKKIKEIQNVFVCFEGSDCFDLREKCVAGLLKLNEIKKIFVVIGGAYNHHQIFNTIKGNEDRVKLCANLSEQEMVGVMKESQLAVIPASTICYEVCSVKMSVLSGYYIDNQVNIYKGLVQKELIFAGDDFASWTNEDFYFKVRELIKIPLIEHQKKVDNQQKFFDGKQKSRFIKLTEEFIRC